MFIDHNHTHQWKQVGVNDGAHSIQVVLIYVCDECDAWTSLELEDTSRVPFRQGELKEESEGENDE